MFIALSSLEHRNNCHNFVCDALNRLNFKGCNTWTVPMLALAMLVHGKYVSSARAFRTWFPFICVVACILAIVLLVVL